MARDMPQNWLVFIGERDGQADRGQPDRAVRCRHHKLPGGVAFGRYWGALERVDCLHFEACYYQPLQWCIEHGY